MGSVLSHVDPEAKAHTGDHTVLFNAAESLLKMFKHMIQKSTYRRI